MATSLTLPPPDLKAAATALDRIHLSYFSDEAEAALTPSELVLRDQLSATWSLLTQYHSAEQAVPVLVKQYGFSRATAYRRTREATKLFGDVAATSKEGLRHILYEYAMKVMQLAFSAKPPDLKQANSAIKQMAMLKGLNNVDAGIIDASALKGGTFLMQINVAGGGSRTVDLDRATRLPADEHAHLLAAVEGTGVDAHEMMQLIDDAAEGWRGAQDPEQEADFEEVDE